MQGLVKLSERYPIIDIRGRGLMVAVEFGGKEGSFKAEPGTATAMVKACAAHNMLLLSAGKHLPQLLLAAQEGWPDAETDTPALLLLHGGNGCGYHVKTIVRIVCSVLLTCQLFETLTHGPATGSQYAVHPPVASQC